MLSKHDDKPCEAPSRSPQDEISCQVCLSTFNDGANAPMLFICGHSYCAVCVAKLCAPLTCPTCRVVTPGQASSLKKNFALIDALPWMLPPKPEDACKECTAEATSWCASCESLCQECSSKLHSYNTFRNHKIVPIKDKATLLVPRCGRHGKKASLYCPVDSTLICALCKDHGPHKEHRDDVMDLSDAAAKRKGELGQVIDRANNAQKLQRHTDAITQAQEAMQQEADRARTAMKKYFEDTRQALKTCEVEMLGKISEQEIKMNHAFNGQRLELANVCSTLKTVAAQAAQVCKGSEPQVLQAPAIVFPEVSVLSGPCYASVEFKLSLPAVARQSVECKFESCERQVMIEQLEDSKAATPAQAPAAAAAPVPAAAATPPAAATPAPAPAAAATPAAATPAPAPAATATPAPTTAAPAAAAAPAPTTTATPAAAAAPAPAAAPVPPAAVATPAPAATPASGSA